MKELTELRTTVSELNKKYEDHRSEVKTKSTELEKIRNEHFVLSKKLQSIEADHSIEIKSLQSEIEDLESKLRASEKKNAEMDNYSTGEGNGFEGNGFDDNGVFEDLQGFDFQDKIESRSRGSTEFRRIPTTVSKNGGELRAKRESIVMNLVNFREEKTVLDSDKKVRELEDKLSEVKQQLQDTKLAIVGLNTDIDVLQQKLKEESRKLDISKRKIEEKNKEIEAMMKTYMDANEMYTLNLNDLNEELEIRDEAIIRLKKELKKMVHSAPVTNGKTKAPEEEKFSISSYF